MKVSKELTILSHSVLSGDQTERTYVIGVAPGEGAFNISSSNVTIEGFHILGSPFEADSHKVGIYLEGVHNCSLSNNTLILNDLGIVLNGSQDNYLSSNLISFGSEGIVLNSSANNTLSNNLVMTNNYGILLNDSANNTVINDISENVSNNNDNKDILLALLKEKYSTDSQNIQKRGYVVGVTKLGEINTSLQNGPVFLKLGAEWCPSCQAMKPILKKLATMYGGKATVMSIDVDQKPELRDYFGVHYIPDSSVIMGIENGEYVYMQENGNVSKDKSQASIVGLKDEEVFEKVMDLALLYKMKEKSG